MAKSLTKAETVKFLARILSDPHGVEELDALVEQIQSKPHPPKELTPEELTVENLTPQIPNDGICPHCLKPRGSVDSQKWTLLPGWVGCKYCFVKFIPDKEKRAEYIARQRAILQGQVTVFENSRKSREFEILRSELQELKTLILQMQTDIRKQIHSALRGVKTETITNGGGGESVPFCLYDTPSPDSHPDLIRANIAERLDISPESLTTAIRTKIGRPCVGYELRNVFGEQFNELFESGSSQLVSSPRGYIIPGKLVARWNEPGSATRDKCCRLVPEDMLDTWSDSEPEYVAHHHTAEYAVMLCDDLGIDELSGDDAERFGWEKSK